MRKAIKKAIVIAKALTTAPPVEEEWYQNRLEICKGCEFNSENVAKESWSLATKIKNDARPGEPVCTACGCWINAKAGVRTEVCGRVKLGKVPLWPALQIENSLDPGLSIDNLSPTLGTIVQEGEIFVINLKKQEELLVLFNFQLIHETGFVYEYSRPSCSCTVAEVKIVNPKICQFSLKISTKEFKVGITERSLEVGYRQGRHLKKAYIKFRYIK